MAHSAVNAVVAGTAGMATEVNYFYQDEKGHILKVIKPASIKEENSDSNTDFASGSNNMGAFNQVNTTNQAHFVRLQPSSYNDSTAYVITSSQQSIGSSSGSSSSNSSNSNVLQSQQQQTHNTANTLEYEVADSYKRDHSSVKAEENYGKYGAQSNNHITLDYEVAESYKRDHSSVKAEENYGKYGAQSNNHNAKSKLNKMNTQSPVQRKRKPDKAGKGLRHFSCKVCEKVKEKGTTTYNEVADELVAEEIKNNSFDTVNCDQKNIRRRVYDALNVLMAMQIISKDKKEIRWIGLPSNSVEQCEALEKANEESRERINQKFQHLRELLLQHITYKSLIERNKEAERQGIIPTPNSSVQLPFIIVNTHKTTKIHCSVTNDKSEYIFKFNDKFEIHDDVEVLKRMGLLNGLDKGQCSSEDIERAKSLVPRKFEKYIEAYGNGRGMPCDSDDEYNDEEQKSPDLEAEEFMDNSDID